ncbi:hypothetical protein [Citrobacter freundii]|uniref:hypothetical protein n=1 Tax=Citrobacter freundii TaxID=546 RepID=UPI0019070626|nr:hypothetical protein [Citrobacter freundii]MBJ8931616.1 hypothetical protein [Citrobacter freundii]
MKKDNVVMGASLMMASFMVYAYCPPQYQEQTVIPAFKAAYASIKSTLVGVDASLSTVLETNSQRLSSAIAVLTKQKALTANQIAETQVNAGQMLAQGMNTISQTQRVKQARFDYGGEFGQGYQPCLISSERAVIATRNADLQGEVASRVKSEIIASPGEYADRSSAHQKLIDAHKTYCTDDEVASGLCSTKGSMPGADLHVSTLFAPAMEGEQAYQAKIDFVNNIAGMPDQPIPRSASGSVQAQAYALAKSRKDALISPALTALKEIQVETSGIDGMESGKEVPLSELYKNQVTRYFGNSDEYQNWTKSLAIQNERGVMIESLKVKALNLALKAKLYKQYETMEAQLATLTATELSRTVGVASEQQARQAEANAARVEIK